MNNEKDFVEMLKQRFEIEYAKKDRSGVYGFTQRQMTYNSNRIEGSTLTQKHTASLFDTGSIMADGEIVRSKDIEEANGHFIMFNHMLETLKEPLSEELIKEYHFKLKNGVFEDLANGYLVGEYKDRRNFVANITTALPNEVDTKMKELLEDYDVTRKHSLEEIAIFHANYENIHPFQDGNGRTGRLIIFRECLKSDIVPLIVEDRNQDSYYFALNSYQTSKNAKQLLDYFKEEQNQYFKSVKDVVIPYNRNTEAMENQEDEVEEFHQSM